VQSGVFRVDKKLNRPRQLQRFKQVVFETLCGTKNVDAIAYERVPVAHSRNALTITNQNELYGAFLIACCNYNPDILVIAVAPDVWHRDCLRIVSNTKDQPNRLKEYALLQLRQRTGFVTTDEDIADAGMVACWALGVLRLGHAKCQLT
jgi:hypothetical protein